MDPKIIPWFVLMMENGDFIRTSGLTLVAGRDIDLEKYPGDTLSCVINETSVKVLGFKSPLGQVIRDVDERWKIVGVVKDFLVGDPNQASEPVLIKGAVNTGYISIRVASSRPFVENARQAEAIIKKYNPNYITALRFADLDYAAKFQQARNAVMLVNTFAFIAIFVACMGLLGLATYMAENRTREIGIRKVLGSGVAAIVSLLAREFVRLILVSIVIASPLAWLLMQFFLQHFTYRTPLNAWVLVISAASALLLALATIAFSTHPRSDGEPREEFEGGIDYIISGSGFNRFDGILRNSDISCSRRILPVFAYNWAFDKIVYLMQITMD